MTTLENNNINEKEVLVLEAIANAHWHAGGDFTYPEEIHEEVSDKLSMNQIKGYLSQLSQKGFITIDQEFAQINFLDAIYKVFPNLDDECYCSVYGKNGNV